MAITIKKESQEQEKKGGKIGSNKNEKKRIPGRKQ